MTDTVEQPVEQQRARVVERTFLDADVRGYTRYTAEQGNEAGAGLATQFAEIATKIAVPRGGGDIELRGDEAMVVFSSTRDALWAAVEMQDGFAAVQRDDPSSPLKVGIGLATGEVVPVADGYRGSPLNLAARLCSLARAGEILVTNRVAEAGKDIPGLTFIDRGRTRLKGIAEPVTISQVVRAGDEPERVDRFSLTDAPIRLPAQVTRFIGRGDALAALRLLLENGDVRLVTLTGTGGTGKTRIAIEAAREFAAIFPGGVYFEALEALSDPALIPAAIAATLDVKESPGRDATRAIVEHLAHRDTLLVLDNFEHLLAGAPVLSALLAACPRLKLLATSRSPLRLAGEHCFEVAPMRVPAPGALPPIEDLGRIEAVRLFVQRARAARHDFSLTLENASAVAEICMRLDGLPLAIELAAARIRILPPQLLLDQLSNRLGTLTRGPRDAPSRHQTLRQAIDWSYNLLTPEGRELLAALSVFAGGWTLEAADAVCGGSGSVLEGLEALVESSLVRAVDAGGTPRFTMLETIREYALERLRGASGEAGARSRHAAYFGQFVEGFRRFGPSPVEFRQAIEALEREHDNLRAALSWNMGADPGAALRAVHDVWRFWWTSGHFSEGERWAETALAAPGGTDEERAGALEVAGIMAWAGGRLGQAHAHLTAALAAYEALGNLTGMGASISTLGLVAEQQGKLAEALGYHSRYVEIARGIGDEARLATALGNLGAPMILLGELERAESLYEESLAMWRSLGAANGVVHQLNPLALLALERGDPGRAARLQREAIALCRTLGNREVTAATLDGAGRVLTARGDHARAVPLWGVAAAVRRRLGQAPELVAGSLHERYLSLARRALGEAEFGRVWDLGGALDAEEALALAGEMLGDEQ